MFTGELACPQCGKTKWHRDMLDVSNVGVFTTQLVCIACGERLKVRSTREDPSVCLVLDRRSKRG